MPSTGSDGPVAWTEEKGRGATQKAWEDRANLLRRLKANGDESANAAPGREVTSTEICNSGLAGRRGFSGARAAIGLQRRGNDFRGRVRVGGQAHGAKIYRMKLFSRRPAASARALALLVCLLSTAGCSHIFGDMRTSYTYKPDYGVDSPEFRRSLEVLGTEMVPQNRAILLENGVRSFPDVDASAERASVT